MTPGAGAPGKGLPVTSVPPCLMCIVQAPGTAVPPSSFTTCFTTVRVGATSLFVMVQVLTWPVASVMSPPAAQSPVMVAW